MLDNKNGAVEGHNLRIGLAGTESVHRFACSSRNLKLHDSLSPGKARSQFIAPRPNQMRRRCRTALGDCVSRKSRRSELAMFRRETASGDQRPPLQPRDRLPRLPLQRSPMRPI